MINLQVVSRLCEVGPQMESEPVFSRLCGLSPVSLAPGDLPGRVRQRYLGGAVGEVNFVSPES